MVFRIMSSSFRKVVSSFMITALYTNFGETIKRGGSIAKAESHFALENMEAPVSLSDDSTRIFDGADVLLFSHVRDPHRI